MTNRDTTRCATLFSFDYPPNDGGVSRLCAAIVSGLAKREPVRLVSQRRDIEGPAAPAGQPITEERVTARRPLREIAAWWHLVRRHRRGGTVIAGTWYPEGVIAMLAGHRNVVVLAHGAELAPPSQRWRRPFWAWLQRRVLERARVVVANSHYTGDLVTVSAPRATVRPIPLAVDHERFAPGDRRPARQQFGVPDDLDVVVLLTVTRLQAFKGIDIALRAIAELPPDQQQRIIYLVAGKGPARAELERLAASLDVADRLRWLGFVPDADLPSLYRSADLFALCTREQLNQRSVEGFGMVFLEAQACGTPVVGARTGGIPDAIREGEGGWLIPQDDATALGEILAELVDDSERFAEQGRLARARVEREATWDHYMQAFTAAIGAGRDG